MSARENELAVAAHNARELWRDVENHLRIARESLEQAQSALDDLRKQHLSENLTATVEAVERFRVVAEGYAS